MRRYSGLRALLNLYTAHQRLVDDRRELDDVLAAGVGGAGECLDVRLVLGPRGRVDVEVGQHLRTVQRDVEGSRSDCREVRLAEMQSDRMAGPRGEARNRVGEVVHAR